MSDEERLVDDPGVPRARQRGRNAANWQQNIAKKKRNSGEAYTSRWSGKEVAKRSVGAPCKDDCFTRISMPIVNLLHEEFWAIGDFALQNAYLQRHVTLQPVKRR